MCVYIYMYRYIKCYMYYITYVNIIYTYYICCALQFRCNYGSGAVGCQVC